MPYAASYVLAGSFAANYMADALYIEQISMLALLVPVMALFILLAANSTFEKPEYTEQREGFYHLTDMQGDVDTAVMHYILRDHDADKLEEKKQCVKKICAYLNEKYGAGSFEAKITDAYRNMREVIENHFSLVLQAEAAMRDCGVEPFESVVRGGTDGASLSFRGIPCPNLSTGGHNCHGRYEFITVQSLEKMTDILTKIVIRHAQATNE